MGWRVFIPREGVAHHEVSVDAQLLAKLANLILEQLPQGLDEFQLAFCQQKRPKMIQARIKYLEGVGQATNVVVCLDGRTGSLVRDTLDANMVSFHWKVTMSKLAYTSG